MVAMAEMRRLRPERMVGIVLLGAQSEPLGVKTRRHQGTRIGQTPASSLCIGMTGNTDPAERMA